MQIGVVFPQIEIGADREAVRAYAVGVEQIGFRHLLAYDHVVGADPASHPGWSGPYVNSDSFHEPLVLFAYLAGICSLEFVSGILILPQRQAVLVAKQAAEVDILSGGRLRLGVGIGWNEVEYEALGEDFHSRGRRIEEQIALMRLLWTEPSFDFSGRYSKVSGAGMSPLPIQRPIPVWMAARADSRALDRVGRLGDGWIPLASPGHGLDEAWARIRAAASEAGRDPESIGVEGWIQFGDGDLDRIERQAERWHAFGATHLSLNTMRAGLGEVGAHLGALARAYERITR